MFYTPPASGSGGAGMQGLLQGMMAGQQSRESTQRMDILQKQQDRADDKYQATESFGVFRNVDEALKTGDEALISQAIKTGNTKLAKLPRIGKTVLSYQVKPFKDEAASNRFKNEFKQAHGRDYDPKTDKRKGNLYISDGETETMFDSDTMAIGSSNYRDYLRDIKHERNLQLIAEKKASKGLESDGESSLDIANRIKAIPPKERTEKQNTELITALKDLKITKEQATQNLFSKTSTDATDLFSGKNFGSLEDIKKLKDSGTFNSAQLNQHIGGKDYADYNKVNSTIGTMGTLYNFAEKFSKISTEDYKSGQVKKLISTYAKRASSEDWKNMSLEDRKRELRTIANKSGVGATVAQILNDLSGASVGEEEFTRISNILTGGDLDLNNPVAVATALKSSADTYGAGVKSKIQGIRQVSAGDKLKLSEQYLNNYKDVKINLAPEVAKPVSADDTAIKVQLDEADQAAGLLSNAGKALYKRFMNKTATEEDAEELKKSEPDTYGKLMGILEKVSSYVAPRKQDANPAKAIDSVKNSNKDMKILQEKLSKLSPEVKSQVQKVLDSDIDEAKKQEILARILDDNTAVQF